MNITSLKNSYPLLLQYLRENNYNSKYIKFIKTEINWILINNKDEWESLRDAFEERITHLKEGCHPSVRSIFSIIEHFIKTGEYPDGRKHHSIIPKSAYCLLDPNGEFKNTINSYIKIIGQGKTQKTIKSEVSSASSFFLFFEKQGIFRLADITEEIVLNYFEPADGNRQRDYGCRSQISIVLKTCGNEGNSDCLQILTYLPKLKKRRKNIQYLTEEELSILKSVLYDISNNLTLRDRAICLLLLFTGIRAVDIAEMKLSSIDWGKSSIQFIQDKTEQPVEIPMNAVTGNAIFEYITKDRPVSSSQYLFLPLSPHHKGHLSPNGVIDIVNRIFCAAGIRQNPGERRGSHIFRHYLASSLLANEVPQPVITSVLGHTSPESLEVYIQADFKHLKECSLSIERYPIRKEVFES